MITALHGAILLGCWAIGLFFFRYWRQTRDPFFWYFGGAFWLLSVERIMLLGVDPTYEFRPYIYSFRLIAFMLILYAIYSKNRPPVFPRD
jgi:hypothetical protein